MANSTSPGTSGPSKKADALDDMPEAEFIERWRAIVGEAPAIMLDSRADMMKLLVESTPIATPERADAPDVSDLPGIEPEKP